MKSQQLKIFIHSYINDKDNKTNRSFQRFIAQYSKEFGVDISYLNTDAYYVHLFEDQEPTAGKKEITFDILLSGISQGYLDNTTADSHPNDEGIPDKPKFTITQIVLGIIVVIISSILLGVIAVYT